MPTIGGCNCCNPEIVPWGVYDQRPIEVRDDVLVYTTPPLEHDLEVTGPVVVHLFAATDGPDTDFTAKLIDVFPDGTAWNLCDGIIRGRYRNGRGPAELLTPGRGLRIRHRLLGDVQPLPSRARDPVWRSAAATSRASTATSTPAPRSPTTHRPASPGSASFHDAEHPSHVVLPVIPA